MELGLSLGDSHKFLENKIQKQQQQKSGIKINGSPDFCMVQSLNSWAVENHGKEAQESDKSDDEGHDHYNLQLNLLRQNGSPENMGLAAAAEASSANSVGYRSTKRGFANDVVDDDEANAAHDRKKLRLSKQQSDFLEESFKQHNALNPKQKLALAKQLNLMPRQVEVWFQNRRARTKLKQTEVECEYLKRSCEKLSQENRKLQKELKELRFLKTPNPPYMQLPPATLTVCPSCHRAAAPSAHHRQHYESFPSSSQ